MSATCPYVVSTFFGDIEMGMSPTCPYILHIGQLSVKKQPFFNLIRI